MAETIKTEEKSYDIDSAMMAASVMHTINSIVNDRKVLTRKVICEKIGCSPEDPDDTDSSKTILPLLHTFILAEKIMKISTSILSMYGAIPIKIKKQEKNEKAKTGTNEGRETEKNNFKRGVVAEMELGKEQGKPSGRGTGFFRKAFDFLRKASIRLRASILDYERLF